MPKKLAVFAAMLVLVLSMSVPALAQHSGEIPAQDEVPACVLEDACRNTSAEHQAVGEQPAGSSPSDIDQSALTPSEDGSRGFRYNGNQGCDSECAARVAQAAEETIGGEDSDEGSDPAAAFGAAMDAALSPDGTRAAAPSERAGAAAEDSEAAAYQSAFEAAKEARLDDEAVTKAAGVAVAEASRTRKGGSPSEGIAAAEGKTRKDESSKDKARENTADEEESTTEEVATSEENDGTGGEDVVATPAGSRVPLLLGGVAFLSVGGYAALRFALSRPPVRGRRLLRNYSALR